MKLTSSLFVVSLLLSCPLSRAASLPIVVNASNPSIRSIFLDGGAENGLFSTVRFNALPNVGVSVELINDLGNLVTVVNTPWTLGEPLSGQVFANIASGLNAGVPRPAGQPFTYRNRVLDRDPFDPDVPGLGWFVLGAVANPNELSFIGGLLGVNVSTSNQPNGRLFLANVVLIPEPTSFSIVAVALSALACGLRRRRLGHS